MAFDVDVDVEEILRRNPQIDRGKFEEGRRALERQGERPLQRREYDLLPSHGGKRVSVRRDLSERNSQIRNQLPD